MAEDSAKDTEYLGKAIKTRCNGLSDKDTEGIITDKMVFVKSNGDWHGQEPTQQDLSSLGLGSLSSLQPVRVWQRRTGQ